MNLFCSLAIAFSMYSRIPMPTVAWTKERMKYAMCFFPLIGVVIGAITYGSVLVLTALKLDWMARIFPVLVPLMVTGGIHMDGFLDVTDARASHAPAEKKLEILKDPHTGAFAIIGCGVYLLLYTAFFGEMKPVILAAYGGSFVITRALSGLAVVTFPMAKNSGLAASFSGQAQKRTVAVTMWLYLVFTECWILYTGGIAAAVMTAAAAALTFLYYYRMSKKEFGGITGDLAGYFLQGCELVLTAVFAAVSRGILA